MKLHVKRLLLAVIMIITSGVVFFTNEVQATDVVTTHELFEDIYAGAAVVIEYDIVPTPEEVDAIVEESTSWKNPGALVMAHATDAVNIREAASTDAEIVGRLYFDCGGYIIEYTDTWTKIQSGNAIGWVCNDYLYFGDEAIAKAEEVGCYRAVVNTNELRVRSEKNTDSDANVLGVLSEGAEYDVVTQEDGWVAIDYEGQDGFISADYVDIYFHIDEAETMEEIEAREEAERQAAREAERYQYYGVYAATASDVELLAAIIECEAGSQPYEGMVAVGAVVMNRVRSASYPNTIYGVVYAPGQFTPAGTGDVDRKIANGINPLCLQAAQEALDGYSNVGDATHFRRAGYHDGIVIGAHVFW